jgi:hypothetical protein
MTKKASEDAAMKQLLQMIIDRLDETGKKVDDIVSGMSDWKVKCVECRNGIDKTIQPLLEKYVEDNADKTIGHKILKLLKSPVFIITVAIYVILASINITTALNAGNFARGINTRLSAVESSTNSYITVDMLKTDLIKIKDIINGN